MNTFLRLLLIQLGLFVSIQLVIAGRCWSQSNAPRVRIGYSAADISFAPIWIAHDQKIFNKYGLESETLYVRGGPTLMQALIAGELQAVGVGGNPIVLATAAGAEVKVVLSFNNVLPYEIFAAPKERDSIRRIADLKGKRVGVSRRGAESESIIRLLLKRAKINPEEVTYLQVGGSGERLAAMEKGAIDATAMSLPLNLEARRLGFSLIATVVKDNMDWLHTALAMNQNYIDKEARTAESIIRAIMEATEFGIKNRELTKKVISKYLKLQDEAILQGAYQYFREFYARDFRPSKQGIRNILEEIAVSLPGTRGFNSETITNLGLIEKAEKDASR